ncbi:MAG: 23S rRNA (adenine(2503)-C(2))-methyltransferase [Candidatus Margulisbacteria bacterium GWF2_35_9]|nr:MAG: 23S rRNA (adenine(2503)-C(2))-methyltransferase [Candidatus Margulisbacteria bacterium GWF2_35_9]
MPQSVFDYNFSDFQDECLKLGLKKYKAKQVFEALYKQKIADFSLMTALSKDERKLMNESFTTFTLKNITEHIGSDTIKYRGEFADDVAIEWVLIKGRQRNTVCISTQAGCALGCFFCATGSKYGFKRDLTAGEIVEQLVYVMSKGHDVNNVVYMGMGEPLLNYDNVIKSIRILSDKDSADIGIRRFTVSTAGIVPGMEKLIKEKLQINLAISLHAANDKLRSKLMPINKKYAINGVLDAGEQYRNETSRRVTLEYILLKGVNDSKNDAYELIQLISYRDFHVNLIPYNDTCLDFAPSEKSVVDAFYSMLVDAGINVTIRHSKGSDIKAACGMLANESPN